MPARPQLFCGVAVLLVLASSSWVDRQVSRPIAWALTRWTTLEVRDYAQLLHVIGGEYGVAEMRVESGDWLEGLSLAELGLTSEGVLRPRRPSSRPGGSGPGGA